MRPKRLTREQSKDQTRERLLKAARVMFMKKGYMAASVEDIAATAGYTRGAFYSNFGGKAELLLELLTRDHDAVQVELQEIFDGGGAREQMEETVLRYYSQRFLNDEDFLLWTEAKLLAARDAKFRLRFNAFMQDKCRRMADYITRFAQRSGAPLPLSAEVLAFGLMSLCDGVQFYYTADPKLMTNELAENVLAGFFARVVLGRAPG
ncbi:TetR/AcrR family transcriptional regulator [Burkholderia sp. FERM BP-3421]|jgi:AcrR family transcriptional regulator|uniref:TetR/AcrR family transcriptional regulator n=1 Tax=Burkholderia sp. FERM BP-3421 TaxID=1494466 RepID=UPI00235E62A9|nr:TetR/AcrR family transcriptional regulator [Burkholderia sp. FERM BP-3421]WDD94071.1 TetR/AcrR family transcriptional regulator [Burkholderia sp. FERM BP-3421]